MEVLLLLGSAMADSSLRGVAGLGSVLQEVKKSRQVTGWCVTELNDVLKKRKNKTKKQKKLIYNYKKRGVNGRPLWVRRVDHNFVVL